MPHECTNCGRVFADGSKEMLSGCPNCGGNKFQFRPSSATDTGAGDRTTPTGADDRTTPTGEDDRTTERQRPDADPSSSGTEPARDTSSPTDDSSGSNAWREAAERVLGKGSDETTDSSEPDRQEPSRQWVNQRRDEPSSSGRDTAPHRTRASESTDRTHAMDSQAQPRHSEQTGGETRPGDTDTSSTSPPSDTDDAESQPGTTEAPSTVSPKENTAQASARSEVVSPDEIAAASPDEPDTVAPAETPTEATSDSDGPPTTSEGRVIEPSSDERPDLDELREELNEQFESIRIVAPGEYELNLMELYDRTEYIISLQEDGRYVIEVPDTWDTTPGGAEDA
ncbi:OapC/ArvC family zinc-ribbon domain-containing protein [Halobellus inordinatus]|uniref:OapC/ArvC family zinc-ribbon domain-containing protein n=1 Tax=Halobellus inordinatus TaxID=1126236 RepID=UPI0021147939|nr:Zn-ribbon containing protein [Halobellus ramosii]